MGRVEPKGSARTAVAARKVKRTAKYAERESAQTGTIGSSSPKKFSMASSVLAFAGEKMCAAVLIAESGDRLPRVLC
jgi:hypothetical protein